ncbi:hypothetical protein C9426_22030 [Serratia sp. S1B]|nr:hypothetical protein C9426_22030 [Serratia sp. S1B]
MPVFVCLFEPKKSAQKNGAISLVYALEAPNKKVAESIVIGKLWEAYPAAGDNFFNPKVVEDQLGCPRPAVGIFDEQFAIDNEFDGTRWQPRQVTEELPSGPIDLLSLPADIKIAAIGMYGLSEIDHGCLSLVHDFRDSLGDDDVPDDTGMRAVAKALLSVPAVGAMYPEKINSLYEAIYAHFNGEAPTEPGARRFANEWVNNPQDREKLVLNKTSADNANSVPDYNTLSMHTALSIMRVHPAEAKATDVRNAKEVIAARDSVWRAWDKSFRVIVGILNVDTDTRHTIISEGLKNLQLINNDEERLHFVKSRLAGNPACPELANYGQQQDETQPEVIEQPEVNNLGNEGPSIDAVEDTPRENITPAPTQQNEIESDPTSPANEVKKATVVALATPDSFVLRADELEKELGDSENLSLWKSVMRTNPRYTKDMGDLSFGGTSINAEYMVMRATESFGPAGIGWGWMIIEDKMVEGAPLSEKIFEGSKYVGKRILRDADGSLLFELNHYLRISLWYIKDGEKGAVENFGSTPYRQTTKNGIYCDSEVHKKSLTDAIKKCLSMLGFSADIWLGHYDDAAYKAESLLEFGIKDAADKADDSTRIRKELDERFKQNVETMRKAVSQNEVSKIASSLTRTVSIHLKSAKDINDQEYTKYLESRLRRLEVIKAECLAKLQGGEAA